jgi:hypothetical protein
MADAATRALAARLLAAHPEHVPVLVENASGDATLANSKFLAARDMRVSHFMLVVRKRMRPAPRASAALYMLVSERGKMAPAAQAVGELYDAERSADGMLRVRVCKENTFGGYGF